MKIRLIFHCLLLFRGIFEFFLDGEFLIFGFYPESEFLITGDSSLIVGSDVESDPGYAFQKGLAAAGSNPGRVLLFPVFRMSGDVS